jgi:hypothetical protein
MPNMNMHKECKIVVFQPVSPEFSDSSTLQKNILPPSSVLKSNQRNKSPLCVHLKVHCMVYFSKMEAICSSVTSCL